MLSADEDHLHVWRVCGDLRRGAHGEPEPAPALRGRALDRRQLLGRVQRERRVLLLLLL